MLGRTAEGEPQRFLHDVVLPHPDKAVCLHWPYNTSGGYGQLRMNGGPKWVHRLVCEATHGPAPTPKHEAAHSCGNGHLGCVNPHHISWKTRAENFADKLTHGTHNQGSKHPLAKLAEDEIREIRNLRGTLTQKEMARIFGVLELFAGYWPVALGVT